MTTQETLPAEIVVDVDSLTHDGRGIARHEGRTVFVRGAVPGDRGVVVQLDAEHSKDRLWQGDFVSAKQRPTFVSDDICPAYARGAGCCDFSHVAPEAGAGLKAMILTDQLKRIAHLSVPINYHSLPPARGWRSRVRLAVNSDGVACYRKANSHELVPAAGCHQLPDGILDNLPDLTAGTEIIIAVDSTGTRRIVELHPNQTRAAAKNAQGRRGPAPKSSGRRNSFATLEGDGPCKQECGEQTFNLPTTAFWQAHGGATEIYRQQVRRLLIAGLRGASKTPRYGWDLYGGVGVFADVLAEALGFSDEKMVQVDSVECDRSAARWGERNVEVNSPELVDDSRRDSPAVRFVTGRVEQSLAQLRSGDGRVDAIVIDPPRSGVGQSLITQLASFRPQTIVHVGCDTATLARDPKAWSEAGYPCRGIELYDAFPGTHHSEAFALLVPGVAPATTADAPVSTSAATASTTED